MKLDKMSISMSQKPTTRNIFFISTILLAFIVVPAISFAFTFQELQEFFIVEIVNNAIILIIALAVAYFLWGVAKYILHSDDAKAREEGKNMMIYGVIALFVMVSMWGLVNLLDTTFFGLDSELDNDTIPEAGDFLE